MGMTQRGLKLLFDYAFQGVTIPTNFYVALVTAATAPSWSTTTFGGLTEITAGNGYTTGGFSLTPNTTDFDAQVLNTTPDFVDQQIKNVTWTASGGNIPGSGDGATYAVLLTDEGTIANRQVITFWLLTDAPRTITSGLTLTLIDAFTRLGGNLSEIPTQQEGSGQVAVAGGSGAFGAWVEMIASTSFKATELSLMLRSGSTFNEIEVGIGAAASEVTLMPTLYMEETDAAAQMTFRMEIAAGTRIACRSKNNSGTANVTAAVNIGGP